MIRIDVYVNVSTEGQLDDMVTALSEAVVAQGFETDEAFNSLVGVKACDFALGEEGAFREIITAEDYATIALPRREARAVD